MHVGSIIYYMQSAVVFNANALHSQVTPYAKILQVVKTINAIQWITRPQLNVKSLLLLQVMSRVSSTFFIYVSGLGCWRNIRNISNILFYKATRHCVISPEVVQIFAPEKPKQNILIKVKSLYFFLSLLQTTGKGGAGDEDVRCVILVNSIPCLRRRTLIPHIFILHEN